MELNKSIEIYQNGEIELEVSVDAETVWLRQNEIASLFAKDRTVITRHINKILEEKEVDEKSNVQKMHFANSDKPVKLYSLDIVLAVGYRTNSAKAIKFRQWATKVLKNYISNGYAINVDKITHDRLVSLEHEMQLLQHKVSNIDTRLHDNSLTPTQGIFYDRQVFDAYVFVAKLIKSAKRSIVLIDNYIDESVLTLFSKNQDVQVTIYTKTISKQLKLDLKKYNAQYVPIEVKKLDVSHDRFLIIDDVEVYHIGASLKDLGKKCFTFSKMRGESLGLLGKLV
ncbi:MAG: DNA-binding protein [Sulfurovum sp.]|nr:DNA-binding protein [Sulfurovum sp.]